ncbi:MAG: hypothetical protein KGI25_03920 [Thaumarchaeota archaeon]|nr:hypothetical protein [Nitrososphaerota archaeon]
MASFNSKYAYPQLYYMLSHIEFKQRQMARDLGYQHGSRISDFVVWLEKLGFVEKSKNLQDRTNAYKIPSPLALIKFYSSFRKMNEIKHSFDWGTTKEKMIEYFKSENAVFCMTTALEQYSQYVRDPAIHVYVPPDNWNEWKDKQFEGNVRVNLYAFKPYRDDNVTEKNGLKVTTALRTLIDLYCDDKAYAAEPLVRQIWQR